MDQYNTLVFRGLTCPFIVALRKNYNHSSLIGSGFSLQDSVLPKDVLDNQNYTGLLLIIDNLLECMIHNQDNRRIKSTAIRSSCSHAS